MMLKTSSNKINPFSNMFKFTFKKNLSMAILLTVGFLLICPSYMLINYKNVGLSFANRQDFFSAWGDGFSLFCGIVSSLSAIALNLLNFSFMFKRSSSDFTDSLPITRAELLFSRMLSGLCLSLIPSVVGLFSLGITASAFGYSAILLKVLINLLYIVIVTAVSSAFSMIFIIASANVFDFLVSFVCINSGLILMGYIIISMFEELLIGYSQGSVVTVLNAVSPPFYTFCGFAFHLFEETAKAIDIGFLLRNVLMIVAFSVVSCLLYKKRKTEATGKAFAYKFLYIICAFLISACASFVLGAVFDDGIDFSSPIFFIFAFLGAILSSVVYGAITFRGFKTIKKSIVIGASSFAFLIVLMLCIKIDFVGFTKRIPKSEETFSATIQYSSSTVDYTDTAFVRNLHNKIISQDGIIDKDRNYGPDVHSITITYLLKNNKTLKREYWIDSKKLESEISQILKSDERFNGILKSLKSTKPQTVSLYMGAENNEDEISDSYLTYDEFIKLLSIYKNEIQNKKIDISSNIYNQYVVSWSGASTYHSEDFYFDDTFTETLKYLEELDVKSRVQKYEDPSKDYQNEIIYD